MYNNSFISGWINHDEWLYVYNNIFSSDIKQQQSAIDVIQVWKVKFGEKIPVAIESTCSLIQAKISCENADPSTQQFTLAFALGQFVGLMTERCKGDKRPMHIVASDLGIPQRLVDIRHHNTHRLPKPLPLIKSAVNDAILWLKNHHWDELYKKCVEPALNVEYSNKPCTDHPIFADFCNMIRSSIADKKNMKNIVNDLRSYLARDESLVSVFVSSLVDGNFFNYEVHAGLDKQNKLMFSGFVRMVKEMGFVHVVLNYLLRRFCESDDKDSDIFSKYIHFCISLLDADQQKNLTKKPGSLNVWKNTVDILTTNRQCKDFYKNKLQGHIQKIFGDETTAEIDELVYKNPGKGLFGTSATKVTYSEFVEEIEKNKQTFSHHAYYTGDLFKNCRFGLAPHLQVKDAFFELTSKQNETVENAEVCEQIDLTNEEMVCEKSENKNVKFTGNICLDNVFGKL